jgi:FkbM family methyltransferase
MKHSAGMDLRAKLRSIIKSLGLLEQARFYRDLLSDNFPKSRLECTHRMQFYRQFIAKNDICIDAGANLGNRTRVFLELGARVVAVEPQPYCARILRAKFGRNPRFTLVESALGSAPGKAEMSVGEAHTIATLSTDLRRRTTESGRWTGNEWTGALTVDVTTLDQLLSTYGMPAFCKIDVEGFELEVLRGASRALPSLSFEFTLPEMRDQAMACLERLDSLGSYRYNYSRCEDTSLAIADWVTSAELRDLIGEMSSRPTWGDIYAKLT